MPDEQQLRFARTFGSDAARVLHPTIRWEEASRLLAQIWPEKMQAHEWSLIEPEVRAGWNEVAGVEED